MTPATADAPPLDVFALNFDTSQRLRHLNALLDHLGVEPGARLLDVGGYPGYMARAFPDRRIVTADIYDKGHPPYIKASGAALPFADNTFDVTFACDVLEHVPPQFRTPFLAELARVSRRAVIVAGPYNTPGVAQAETIVRGLLPPSSPAQSWLAEHTQCGLPSVKLTVDDLQTHSRLVHAIPAGSLTEWLLFFAAQAAGEHRFELAAAAQDFMQAYNRQETLQDLTGGHKAPYRHAVVAALDERMEQSLASLTPKTGTSIQPETAPAIQLENSIESLGRLLQLMTKLAVGTGIHTPSPSRNGDPASDEQNAQSAALADPVMESYVRRLEQMLSHRGINPASTSAHNSPAHATSPSATARLKRAWRALFSN